MSPDEVSCALAGRLRRDDARQISAGSRSDTISRLTQRIERLAAQPHARARGRRLARLWAERAFALSNLGEWEAALSSVEAGQRIPEVGNYPAENARLLLAGSNAHWATGEAAAAREYARRAAEAGAKAGEQKIRAATLSQEALAAEQAGDLPAAVDLARSSLALCEGELSPEWTLLARRRFAFCLWRAGRFAEAALAQRRNLEDVRTLGKVESEGYVLSGLGGALLAMEDLDAAEGMLGEAAALVAQLADTYLLLPVEYNLANLWKERAYLCGLKGSEQAAREAKSEAETRFERVLGLSQATRSSAMAVFTAVDLACHHLQWGNSDRASQLIGSARRGSLEIPENACALAWVTLVEAELDQARGDTELAARRVKFAIPIMSRASPAGLAQAHRDAARAAATLGATVEAAHHFAASARSAAQCGQRMEELRTRQARTLYQRAESKQDRLKGSREEER